MKICALIPSYNEAKTIGSLVEKVKAKKLDVVVIDDGSIDRTAEIARASGADVVKHRSNLGKGASLQSGFHYIINKDYDAVITMDGDGQHSPEDIANFIHRAADPNADMVVGDRMSSSRGMPLVRWLTNGFMSSLISLICHKDIPDSQCGFRLIKSKVLKELNPISANYEIESEAIIAAHYQGFQIVSIPIRTIYAKQRSRINPVVDTIRFFKFMLKMFCPFLFNKR